MDSRALIVAFLGVFFGLLVAYGVVKRQWWLASANCAFGTLFVLLTVTEGNHSHAEHNVVLAAGLLLLAYWGFAVMKARRRNS